MSLVSSRVSLIHRTRTQRDQNLGTPDEWGTPSTPDFEDYLTGLPCRFWTTTGREIEDQSTSTVVEQMWMIVELGTDVTERDRISGVCYRDEFIATGPISIRAVIQKKDHILLALSRVSD